MRPFGNHYGCLLLQTSQVSLGGWGESFTNRVESCLYLLNDQILMRGVEKGCDIASLVRLRLSHPTRGLNCFAWLTTEIWACSKVLSPLPASACADVINVTLDCKITNGMMSVGQPKRICAVEKNKTQIYSEAQKSLAAAVGEKTQSTRLFFCVFFKRCGCIGQTNKSIFVYSYQGNNNNNKRMGF